jgi:hypothetical protein
VRAERDVFGGSPRIFGETPEFGLRFTTTLPLSESDRTFVLINISGYMEEQLAQIEGITVIPT